MTSSWYENLSQLAVIIVVCIKIIPALDLFIGFKMLKSIFNLSTPNKIWYFTTTGRMLHARFVENTYLDVGKLIFSKISFWFLILSRKYDFISTWGIINICYIASSYIYIYIHMYIYIYIYIYIYTRLIILVIRSLQIAKLNHFDSLFICLHHINEMWNVSTIFL